MRMTGFEEQALKGCYDSGRAYSGNNRAAGFIIDTLGYKISSSDAQAIYYRLTGTPYNEVPRPVIHSRLTPRTWASNHTFDTDQGGDRVGGRLRGLSLDTSRIDTHIDPNALLRYTEWTMEFENVTSDVHEARCQVQLPPGGVVSRVTLWINGEPEEAAFGPNTAVKKAYKQVVTVERRDPVLVTVSGPDRVLVQCYPVPSHGRMKIRFGITSPWNPEQSEVALPQIIEQNFSTPESLDQNVWLQGGHLAEGVQLPTGR